MIANHHSVPLGRFKQLLEDSPKMLTGLSPEARSAFMQLSELSGSYSRLQFRKFALDIFDELRVVDGRPNTDILYHWALRLGKLDRELAVLYLKTASKLFTGSDEAWMEWTVMAHQLAELDTAAAGAFLANLPDCHRALGQDRVLDWGRLALDILQYAGPRMKEAVTAYLEVSTLTPPYPPLETWKKLLGDADRVSLVCPPAAAALIRLGPQLDECFTDETRNSWVITGLALCRHEAEYLNYFNEHSIKLINRGMGASALVQWNDRAQTLALICNAFLGRPIRLQSNRTLANINHFQGGPATDGQTIYLPPVAAEFEVYKLMALHQAAVIQAVTGNGHGSGECPAYGALHLEADRLLLERFPNIRDSMTKYGGLDLPSEYPYIQDIGPIPAPPWWGDWLPFLAECARNTGNALLEKATGMSDLPPEMIEALLAGMMADGDMDPNSLWARLWTLFDIEEMESPEEEDLGPDVLTFLYPEWDHTIWDYKQDWCVVRERTPSSEPHPFAREALSRLSGLVTHIRRFFLGLKPETFRRYRAQSTGDELDLDAAITALIEAKAGFVPPDNVYLKRDKRIRDVSVLFLLDASKSTEEEVEGRRIIDVQKEAMLVMAEALKAVGDRFSVFAFGSEGRFRVDMMKIKGFAESWGDEAKNRLGRLEPKGMTRLGSVIRHAAFHLGRQEAATKLMIVFTDGRPFDLEYGNLDYAIEDTRKALLEAGSNGLKSFIITSDQQGSDYLHRISPRTQSIILQRVERLPALLPDVYRRLTT